MIERGLKNIAFSKQWGRQMRFVAGPRQSGKTTLVKAFLKENGFESLYYNWDRRELKTQFHKGIDFLKKDLSQHSLKRKPWVSFDEIHKMPRWKDILKSYFDEYEPHVRFIVTGSARLDWFRRSGDSLAGRYFLFHLLPLTLSELTNTKNKVIPFKADAEKFIQTRMDESRKAPFSTMEDLLMYGGFPEPFQKGAMPFLKNWHRDYLDRLVREDIRDLTRVMELEKVANLALLLPERVGNPLSINSLREDLEVSHAAVSRYVKYLKLTYFLFDLSPYSRSLNRSLTKDKKAYFYDWTMVPDPGNRFENYVAAELLSLISSWSDQGLGDFQLNYLRTRDGRECDFLIQFDRKPWLMIEAKLNANKVPTYLRNFSKILGNIPVVILTRKEQPIQMDKEGHVCMSAARFLA